MFTIISRTNCVPCTRMIVFLINLNVLGEAMTGGLKGSISHNYTNMNCSWAFNGVGWRPSEICYGWQNRCGFSSDTWWTVSDRTFSYWTSTTRTASLLVVHCCELSRQLCLAFASTSLITEVLFTIANHSNRQNSYSTFHRVDLNSTLFSAVWPAGQLNTFYNLRVKQIWISQEGSEIVEDQWTPLFITSWVLSYERSIIFKWRSIYHSFNYVETWLNIQLKKFKGIVQL